MGERGGGLARTRGGYVSFADRCGAFGQLNIQISNIVDWGCTTRRMEIEKQAKVIGKRKWPAINEDDVYFASYKRNKSV